MTPPVALPPGVLAMADRGQPWAAWVRRLPRLLGDVVDDWDLTPDGEATHGHRSLVVPVLSPDGAPAVLKVGHDGDDEDQHEALALQRWSGDGAVRLLRADPRRRLLLLERLGTTDLTEEWDVAACEVVGAMYARLHVPAPPQLRTLASYVGPWTDRLAALPRDAPLPRRLVEQACSLGRSLLADPAGPGRLLHGDLHYAHVLAADREPWLAIDPKPVSGDPHSEVAPLLRHRWEELAGDVRRGVRARFHAVVDAAGFDEDRARDWVVVRAMCEALWVLEEPGVADVDRLTRCVTLAKAVQE